ncbi:MAG: hypothetical protein JST54_17735 [Deltaproteobacteria bacterium]|nr:hypothetical protein [Deltaproteobacteria bacterium]
MLVPLAPLLLVAALADAPPDVPGPRWELSAAAQTSTPLALDQGLALGATAEVRRTLGLSPFFASGRLGWALASAANESWLIDHHQLQLAAAIGAQRTLGSAQLFAQLGAGGAGVYEVLSRHQIQRIQAAGVPGGRQTSWSWGPELFGEIGLTLHLRAGIRGLIAVGPCATWARVDGATEDRLGGFARLGAAYDL